MRISFVGKGGSGKSTLTALFAQYANQNNNVLAIDADLNIHLPKLLGNQDSIDSYYISNKDNSEKIRNYLKGDNNTINKLAEIKKTTPPGTGSKLIFPDINSDPMIKNYSIKCNDINLIVTGTYDEHGIGASCYHNDLAVLEYLLSHVYDDKSIVVADMVAGTDAFASTLHAQFDLNALVVEPTWRGIEVFNDYTKLCNAADCDHGLRVVGNKIKSEKDEQYLRDNIPEKYLIGFIYRSDYLEEQDRNRGFIEFDKLEAKNKKVFNIILEELNNIAFNPDRRLKKLYDLHKKYVSQSFVKDRFGDLSCQIDDEFDIKEAAKSQRI